MDSAEFALREEEGYRAFLIDPSADATYVNLHQYPNACILESSNFDTIPLPTASVRSIHAMSFNCTFPCYKMKRVESVLEDNMS